MIHRMGWKLRAKLHEFSGEVSVGLGKVKRRLVEEMIFGFQARGSVRLSEVARSLEEPIALRKTHDRLSRNLADPAIRGGGGDLKSDDFLFCIKNPVDLVRSRNRQLYSTNGEQPSANQELFSLRLDFFHDKPFRQCHEADMQGRVSLAGHPTIKAPLRLQIFDLTMR